MASTPKKLVHWANSPDQDLGSPFSEGSSTDSECSTSSLQYINAQLVAHGFARAPGLSLDGLSKDDGEKVVKCILGLLSQRMEDMGRIEQLSTKLSTLSYDHDRISAMHRTALERASAAEKESTGDKSRLAASQRALQASETAHKHTTAELQRTRGALQTVRQTHTAELKRREKEADRMMERWGKIADAQVRLGAVGSGITNKFRHANALVMNSGDVAGKGNGLIEQALEDAEQARKMFGEENSMLKEVILRAANDLSAALHNATTAGGNIDDETAAYSISSLFPLSPPGVAHEKLRNLISSVRETLATQSQGSMQQMQTTASSSDPCRACLQSQEDITRLQGVVDNLRVQVEQEKKHSAAHSIQSRVLLDQLATASQRQGTVTAGKHTRAHESDDKLLKNARDLEAERDRITRDEVNLAQERAELELLRQELADEKRKLKMQRIPDEDQPAVIVPPSGSYEPDLTTDDLLLAHLPPLPRSPPLPHKSKSPSKSTRHNATRSPAKKAAVPATTAFAFSSKGGVGGSKAKVRHSPARKARATKDPNMRRSLAPSMNPRVVPAFETEYMPPMPVMGKEKLLVETAFVLPPPSPLASVRPREDYFAGPSRTTASLTQPTSNSGPHDRPTGQSTTPGPPVDDIAPKTPSPPPIPGLNIRPKPFPFPVAKPLAQGMLHAYSPARPSPLSRILMLSESPASLSFAQRDGDDDENHVGGHDEEKRNQDGVGDEEWEEEDESPLREKMDKINATAVAKTDALSKSRAGAKGNAKGKERAHDKDRGKPKPKEKENTVTTSTMPLKIDTDAGTNKRVSPPLVPPVLGMKTSKSAPGLGGTVGKTGVAAKHIGPRRVPIGSAEAAPIVWKG
ncbi:hypothetical protein BD410DRAFT_783699 [Rickenella mellea]|uniref:Afadin and alpha-actinin-binding-domain-containing protein n=1 Tax=Rickenella mellea TaxID=50990 RepID=A0A4Y7QIA2_9AGAM|nr:hypothetical protein BD410DRAFT_783699 [Rickenella mellea]